MASRLTLRHTYPSPPQHLREVFTDRHYVQAKLDAVGGPRAELVSWEQQAGGTTFVMLQAVPENALPSFLRSMLPHGLTIRRTETWTDAGGSVQAVVDGMPGTISGVMRFEPDSAGCALDTELTAEVPLPLIGGKVEKIITSNVANLLETEHRFALTWLAKPVNP